MSLSQKCQYTLRALFELAKCHGLGPATVAQLAAAQEIPLRFLEVILQELRATGTVDARRGPRGGYVLVARPDSITVGDIIRLIDGSLAPIQRIDRSSDACARPRCAADGRSSGRSPLEGLFHRAEDAVRQVFDSTTLQDLIEEEMAACYAGDYCI